MSATLAELLREPLFPTEEAFRPTTALAERKNPSAFSLLTEDDLEHFVKGRHSSLYSKLGAHLVGAWGDEGVYFAVWAPQAAQVFVVGDFNDWQTGAHPLRRWGNSGIWETFVSRVPQGAYYKFRIVSALNGQVLEKADPLAFRGEVPPRSASIVWNLDYAWGDAAWLERRRAQDWLARAISIYEVHAGSWMRMPEESNRWLTYRELAPKLAGYARDMGFTHVELLPLAEHPFYGSWGYQPTGFFAPTGRYGTPQDLMYFVDYLHQQGIGVILDWVPLHFPYDGFGLARFDGACLYEHEDPRNHHHPEWRSVLFDYGRPEVRSFLLSNALFWLRHYHVDGLRADAVSFMLYHDYCRKPGQWAPNRNGGRENLDAVLFLQRLHEELAAEFPDVPTCAEEATAYPKVSGPTREGGLGFTFKWDMGWMHDTLEYTSKPFHVRRSWLNKLTFRMLYAFTENFMLPLSHDEVVHCKRSLLNKMPGSAWDKFAGLRLLYGYLHGQPGKKLLFMGGEFAQQREWNHDQSLDWHLLNEPGHRGIQRWVRDLNHAYAQWPALHELDCDPAGFEWVDCQDHTNQVLSFLRKGRGNKQAVLVVCHFLPGVLRNYRVGVPWPDTWRELLNSDAREYGGSGAGNNGGVSTEDRGWHGRPHSLNLTIPSLAALFFVYEPASAERKDVSVPAEIESGNGNGSAGINSSFRALTRPAPTEATHG
ncbi:MAG TPA: 1,4-alpha-glucan branching protein GlgB [Verrucomicrobiae bacterium]|nr:1,4-alpha-glucan branching protein GlgB [Verrucomicrobiae bacterium]